MPSFENARQLILEHVAPLPSVTVLLHEAVDRVAAEDVVAAWDLPSFDNSAMDGYAVRSAEFSPGASLQVAGTVMAGDRGDGDFPAGAAVKIMTGAPIPTGFDAVIPFEDMPHSDGASVTLPASVKRWQHIRFAGEDIRAGKRIVSEGTVLRPAEINMLAACGATSVTVYRRARVAILSTGDELVEAGTELTHGKIINSNAPALAAAVLSAGGEPLLLGIASDTKESLREKISEGLKADMLVTSAGVSAGERDLVREVLEESGVKPVFWKIDVKPGGPTAFGIKEGKPVFSLPGNPVSSVLMFEEFARPALLRMMGHQKVLRPVFKGVLGEDVEKKMGKSALLRVRVERRGDSYVLTSSGKQQTGLQRTLLNADGVAILSAESETFAKGEVVEFHFLHDSALLV